MIDPVLLERANEVLDRLFALDEALANARAFRATLEDLHGRDLSVVKEPHIAAIAMVRAGTLRAMIGTIMACLDRSDRRGNRASVGQILDMLDDAELVAVFPESATAAKSQVESLQQVQSDYAALQQSDLMQRGRRLRDDAIAHVLVRDDPTPVVTYETLYNLHDAAERLVTRLYAICDRGKPQFLGHQPRLAELAKVFWDTYFAGMRCAKAEEKPT
jgi:hypothetical protein